MALMDFIKKQFIDIIEWTEAGDGTLAWRFPMQDREIQNGASLTVRESQMAVFVNEGKVADVFGPGRYTLTTATLPVLTYLQNWDKLFKSPFKSDVYFFSTRQQVDQRWGTTQPVTIRDKDFGAVRLRAFGNYAYRIADPKAFHTEISGTRDSYSVAELDGQLRATMLQHISDAVASSGIAFLDLAANQIEFANQLKTVNAEAFAQFGLALETVTVQNVSLPEELQHLPVVSSPLLRCRQTAQSLGLTDIQVEPRLTEMAWGRWEGQTLASLRAQFGDALQHVIGAHRGQGPQGPVPRRTASGW